MRKLGLILVCLLFVGQVLSQAKPWNRSKDLFWTTENIASSSNHFVYMNDAYGLGWWKMGKSNFVFSPLLNYEAASFGKLQQTGLLGAQLEVQAGEKLYVKLGAGAGSNQVDQMVYDEYDYEVISNAPYYMFFEKGYDLDAVVSYSPNNIFNLQAGVGKFHLGNGQRSLLLSDVGRNYPYAALNTIVWKFKLLNLYQLFKEEIPTGNLHKFAATHYLSVDLTPNLEFSLFESVVFQPSDTTWKRGFELEYLNPLLFYRPAEYGLGSSDNVLLGMNVNYKLGHHLLFGQVVLDDGAVTELINRTRWWANKYGVQIGVKGNLLDKKLHYSTEVNAVRPFTYSHLNTSQNYGNRGFVLAHPAGSNFIESFSKVQYEYKEKWQFNFTFMHLLRGGENDMQNLSSGTNPYQPYTEREDEYGYTIANGGALRRTRLTLGAQYELVSRIHLVLFVNAIAMNDRMEQVNNTSFGLQFGVKTNLWKSNSFSF
ncbi:hypothetical protein SAMN05216474_2406 [Lishizhenia tianjinensis]|uniref:Capsule assembly protein Wzi n=1 Tax=Lishizhenia tianjinensis TaxID=477690 RepID=A0A1I7AYX7_9FLAO|nr:hypothetical protein [Lishizhenia tianjinensis]SFT80140.1 hypothetical protein SAMN05216474_2406 [Lishizhenia tianjinensis]